MARSVPPILPQSRAMRQGDSSSTPAKPSLGGGGAPGGGLGIKPGKTMAKGLPKMPAAPPAANAPPGSMPFMNRGGRVRK